MKSSGFPTNTSGGTGTEAWLVNADQGWVGLVENILKSINLNKLGVLDCFLFPER